MSLSVGIVGLPNVGKSTLFNALLKKQQAYVANFPFATVEPNIGVVPVPDERLKKLAEVVARESSQPPIVPATVQFVDIAGLIAGAHKGEGLGNKFLSHIREVDAVCHTVRLFSDPEIVKSGTTNPKEDFETVETELKLADLQTLEKQKDPGNTPDENLRKKWELIGKLKEALNNSLTVRTVELSDEEQKYAKELSLLTAKPVLVVLNVDEADLKRSEEIEEYFAQSLKINIDQVIAISAKVESELADLSDEDQKSYLKDLGVEKSGLARLAQKAFATLGLITFYTIKGGKEVHAWSLKEGRTALDAAGEVHTDFAKNFIKAESVNVDELLKDGGWKEAKDRGQVRLEGRDYIVQDGDVIEFKIGT